MIGLGRGEGCRYASLKAFLIDHSRNATLLVDQNVIDAADLVIRRVVNILLVELVTVVCRPAGGGRSPLDRR